MSLARSWHRGLLFRSYLFLAAGLLIVAVVLDAGFARLQSGRASNEDVWLERTFRLIETEIAAAPATERDSVAAQLGRELGVGVQVLDQGDVVHTAASAEDVARLTDGSGEVSYLRGAPSLAASIRIGPVAPQRDSFLQRALPPLFYLSIFVVVGLWLGPLLRDLDLITNATQRFAADYREPMQTAHRTTQLTSLAQNLDAMSARLSGLVQSQKELAAALSHEMRTPLARIRFALAVLGHGGSGELQKQVDAIGFDLQEIDGLIGSILNYARLDHPDLRMNIERVPLAAWVEQALDKCRQPGKDLDVIREQGFEEASVDPRLMAIALSNLVVNACRHARARVRLTLAQDARGYALIVEDDGEGIPAAQRESVFKPFTRLDTSRNRAT
ncbi:MAG TPA: histidine kinase dimerization/phospho-acceptor domain-containing protein, partial [Gammaproteobacteria bacterium]|nr:histidine kinase dimerization/phospho-acceptor domain-containing protein [Gammaproteobacteria bacterium]